MEDRPQNGRYAYLSRRLLLAAVGLTVFGLAVARWFVVYADLNRPERLEAWQEIQRRNIPELRRAVGDPQAVRLWIAAGRDVTGNDCAGFGRRPSAFVLAFVRPLGFCGPPNADSVPFLSLMRIHGPDAIEAARAMIAAGVDVNEASPDGVMPLRSAVLYENEDMVRILLEAGADPNLRPAVNHIGDFRSAVESAALHGHSPRSERIRQMLHDAAAAENSR